jgi:folate-binding protein YgfZ
VILLRTDVAAADGLVSHLKIYGIFDDVAIEDQSARTFEYHVAGPAGAEIVRPCSGQLPEDAELAHVTAELTGKRVRLIRESPTGVPGLTLVGDIAIAETIKSGLLSAGRELGLIEAGSEAFEVLRIEAGTPIFGKDITDKNLPQEIGRDARAINFVKGCYLGQETVARLDALGHVNQMLLGLILAAGSPCPPAGSVVEDAGKRVGSVTSSAYSPLRSAPIALAFIRTSHMAAGTSVQVALPDGDARIAAVVRNFDLPRGKGVSL